MVEQRSAIPVIGFTGGVGAGKSALAAWLGARLELRVLDADEAGHRALREPAIRHELVAHFGPEILEERGEIARPRLARLVFGDSPEHQRARQQLESIVHPAIRRRLHEQLAEIQRLGEAELVILDAAVMLESGWSELCDLIVFVETTFEVRSERVAATRGWSEDELRRREASQWPLDRKRAASDAVVDNSASLADACDELCASSVPVFHNWPPRLDSRSWRRNEVLAHDQSGH
ncbi:MAG: dephospho-CoA kinase [Planctomycetaceae bacterium]